jgi:hypothetical protein
MYSGGLDSALAIKVVKAQGIHVVAFHMVSAYCRCTPEGEVHPDIIAGVKELGVELHCFDANRDLTSLVLQPAHGFGKHLNPCLDCRINTIRRAEEFRKSIGADFLVTGEVLGQRPMSQNRRSMTLVEEACGCGDILLRPLCARLLDPTLPEREGWIDRDVLPEIQGRSRSAQLALAKEYGLTQYGTPAGGCLLTEAGYCRRYASFLETKNLKAGKVVDGDLEGALHDITTNDLLVLRVGRHFRGEGGGTLVSGRDEGENRVLESLARPGDLLFQTAGSPGSVTLLRPASERAISLYTHAHGGEESVVEGAILDEPSARSAAGLSVHYSKCRKAGVASVEVREAGVEPGHGPVVHDVPCVSPDSLVNLSVG